MIGLLFVLLCGFFMRVKGGGLPVAFFAWRDKNKVLSFVLSCRFISSFLFGLAVFALFHIFDYAAAGAVAWFIGCTFPVRNYLRNLGNMPDATLGDQEFAIKILTWIFTVFHVKITTKNIQSYYGWGGTFIRGVQFAVPMAAAFWSPWPALTALLMPVAYKIGFSINRKITGLDHPAGWAEGEIVYGLFIGVGVFLCHLTQ